jgi:hypothetical protein
MLHPERRLAILATRVYYVPMNRPTFILHHGQTVGQR